MEIKSLVISIVTFLSTIHVGLSQNATDSIYFDSVYVKSVNINGLTLGDSENMLFRIMGNPSSYTEEISEYDGTKFYLCSYLNKASFVLNANKLITDIEYFMLEGHKINMENKTYYIGDTADKFFFDFPNSYKKYLRQQGNIFYLIGIVDDKVRAGINFQFVIRNNRLFSFSSNTEQ